MNLKTILGRLPNYEDPDLHGVEFYGGVSKEDIAEAANQLDVRFPDDYVEFLREFGCGGVSSEEFIGLGGPKHLGLDVVTITTSHRQTGPTIKLAPLWHSLIPVHGDGFGNHDCLDTSKIGPDGICPVVEWDHDGGPNQRPRVLADSYWEWFSTILDMIDELDRDEEVRR